MSWCALSVEEELYRNRWLLHQICRLSPAAGCYFEPWKHFLPLTSVRSFARSFLSRNHVEKLMACSKAHDFDSSKCSIRILSYAKLGFPLIYFSLCNIPSMTDCDRWLSKHVSFQNCLSQHCGQLHRISCCTWFTPFVYLDHGKQSVQKD